LPPNTDGQWTGAQPFSIPNNLRVDDDHAHSFVDQRGLFVLHAVLLHSGKVLCFCGCVETAMYAPYCYLFDPDHPTVQMTPISFPPHADMFCCHYVQIPDGRIMTVGGSQHDVEDPPGSGIIKYRGSNGSRTIALFDPATEAWEVAKTGAVPNELKQGRWYPTAVALPDGRVAVFSGRRERDEHAVPVVGSPFIADMVEILSPPDWGSTELTGATRPLPIYPGLHLAPNGRIYFTHTCWGQEMPNPDTTYIQIPDRATSVSGWTDYPGIKPPHPRREEGMSVLLPPAQDGKILVIGGSQALDAGGGPTALNGGNTTFDHIESAADPIAVDILDTNINPPANPWLTGALAPPSMHRGRVNGHCVLLPNATVLICGGHDKYKWRASPTTTPSLPAEIYTPSSTTGGSFTLVDAMHDPRMYHSVALLLSDGRVFTAGGADPNQEEPPPVIFAGSGAVNGWDLSTSTAYQTSNYPAGWQGRQYTPGHALNSKTYEFYEPPYMHNPNNAARPVIDEVLRNGAHTARIEYGQTFTVRTSQAGSIDDVALMRPNACTHHTDTDQRFVRLTFTRGSGELTVTAVADAKVAPPGYYMLWIVDNQGRPCQRAWFVQLVPLVGQPGGGTSCFVATAAFGSPHHQSVAYLQRLREELRAGTVGGRAFIAVVNRVYGRFSPGLARKIDDDAVSRAAVRDMIVTPAVVLIGHADRFTRWLPWRRLRHALLIALLGIEALVGAALLPVAATAVLVRIALARRRERRANQAQEE